MARVKYTKQEIKQKRKELRQKAALRSYRFRGFKNFLFWLTGVISAFVILITGVFVGVKFVPLSVYLGDTSDALSKDVSSKSIFDALMYADTYDMSDFPFIISALTELKNDPEVSKFVDIDTEKLSKLKFTEKFGEELASCIKVVANLESVGGASILGDFGNLELFNTWQIVPEDQAPVVVDGTIKKENDAFVNNPKLYYYKQGSGSGPVPMSTKFSNSDQWVRAFDDNGKLVDGYNGEQLYFANLSVVPLLDVIDLIDESIGRLSLNSIISSFGGGSGFADSFLGNILDGKNISDLENISGEDILLCSFLGEYNDDTKLMYDILCSIVIAEEKPTYNTLSLAHLQNGIAFEGILISSFIQGETLDLFSSIIVDKEGNSVSSSELSIGHLTTGKFKLDSLKLADFLDKKTIDLLCSIVVDKNGNSINASDLTVGHLTTGDFKLESLKLADYIDKKTIDLLCSIIVDENGNFINASDLTVGHLTTGDFKLESLKLADFLDEKTIDLLCSILVDENGDPILAKDLTVGHLSTEWKIADFAKDLSLEEFLGSYSANKEMYDLLHSMIIWEEGDTIPTADKLTVGDLSKGIDIDKLSLSQFLGIYSANKEMYDMLHSIINWKTGETKPTADKLTVGHLSNGINFDNLSLQNFLGDYDTHKDMYEMLHSIINWKEGVTPPPADSLTVGDLSNGIDFDKMNYNKLSLSKFLGSYEEHPDMYDLLHAIIDWQEGDEIPAKDKLTVGDLAKGIEFDKLSLDHFLGAYESNKLTYDVLCSAVGMGNGAENYSKLTIAHLKGDLDFTIVPLEVLGFDGATLNMLLNAVNASLVATENNPIEKGELTINHIKSGVLSYIALTDVLPFDGGENGNSQLYSILLQASGVSITNPADKNELSTKAKDITINSLSSFKIELVNLSTILPVGENDSLYKVLVDVTGKDAGVIKISDFANFDASKIHLSTVMTQSNNAILKKLIESGATIGELGSAIDGLSLYDIYGQNCFVERKPGSTAPSYRYDTEENAYILDEDGTYEISKNSGIWLLLCFDSEGIETTNSKAIGCAQKYTIGSATLSALTSGAGITEKITNATIRQLVDAGILSSALPSVYTKTLQQVANGQII